MELMLVVVDRRIPERHDRIAHVLVDRSLAIENGVGQRRQKSVHQRGETLRIVLVEFRNRGEASDVGKHYRHLALFPAEHELFRRLRELLDQRRRQVSAKSRANLSPLSLLPDEAGKNQRQVDRGGGYQRIAGIDQQPIPRVKIPRHPDQH